MPARLRAGKALAVAALAAVLLALAPAACKADLEGAPCPCVDGYTCVQGICRSFPDPADASFVWPDSGPITTDGGPFTSDGGGPSPDARVADAGSDAGL